MIFAQMKEQIKNYLNRYVKFSEEEIDTIYNTFSTKTYRKKELLIEQGEICTCNFFVIKGLLYSYNINHKGDKNITQFALENWWITNLESFINNTPSANSIEAIEETTVLYITKNQLEGLYQVVPKLERVFRIIAEKTLIALQRKDEVYMKQNSKERYSFLVSQHPKFAQRVPQYMIASYLDITPEYLSEIRKQ